MTDVNGDGWMDIVTGWEQGKLVRVCINPGPTNVKTINRWPAMTVGRAADVEDAVAVDRDEDGHHQVVTSSEGKTRSISVHTAPEGAARWMDADTWTTEVLLLPTA